MNMRTFQKVAAAALAFVALSFASITEAQGQHGGAQNTDTAGVITTRKIYGGAVNPTTLSTGLRQRKYIDCLTNAQPSLSALNGYGDPTGTAADINTARFPCGLTAQYIVKGTQTLLGPLLDTAGKGLDISQDQTDNDGVEYVFGALNTYGAFTKTVGTDAGFCLRVNMTIADVSGTDDLAIGWRKNETSQANLDDYDEMAVMNTILGVVNTETILNNAATVTTDTTKTWADNANHTVEVCINGRNAYYYFDNVRVQKTVAYAFDNAEVVVPFLFFLQATTSPGKVWLKEVEIYDQDEANSRK
jgi:hypothetical protein